ncbi:MAG: hypothetical protein HYZ79_06075 [Candidatus Melainabacteria bacterium]|nr:hypothetical protein [Candidatus Melainabacteria bacterium]
MNNYCLACKLNKEPSGAIGGTIKDYNSWVLQHIIEPIPVKGWLILKTKRHVDGIIGLNKEESKELGVILNTLPKIQKEMCRADQIYICCFTESVSHMHFHLIPRYPEEVRKGPKIFDILREVNEGKSMPIDAQEVIKLIEDLKIELGR